MDLSINRGASLHTFKAITVPLNDKGQKDLELAKKSVEDLKIRDLTSTYFDGKGYCTIFFNRKEKERDFILELHEKGIDFQYYAENKMYGESRDSLNKCPQKY